MRSVTGLSRTSTASSSSPLLTRSSSGLRDRSKNENLLQWTNYILQKSSKDITVTDLGTDFGNGVLLAKLLSVLSKQDIGKLKEPTSTRKLQRFEALGNLSACFEFMKRVGVKISNIGPEDVLTGNVKLIQGLIWTLINFFLVEVEPDEGEIVTSPSDGSGGRKLTAKQRLLEWTKVIVNAYPGVEVTNWRNGFNDGLALCALVHFHAPRELDYYALDKSDVKANLALVFELLKRRWGIPQLVDPEELQSGRADEDTIVALIATCKRELKTVPEPESLTQIIPFPSQQTEESAQWESRKLLKLVLECAKKGDRKGMDEALVDVLKAFREVLQETDDLASSATAKRQNDIRAVRQRLDRALRDLATDAVGLCKHPKSAVHSRLARRDVMALCAAESELMRMCGDDTDVSKKALIEQLRSLRTGKDGARILQVSKLLEQEHSRLAEATKSRVLARQPHMVPAQGKVAHLMVAELECMSPRFAPLAAKLAEDPNNKETQRELAELNRDITGIMADLDVTLAVDVAKELAACEREVAAALEKVNSTMSFTLDSSLKLASHVGSRCQSALSCTRSNVDIMPKHLSKPVLRIADELDESLTQLQHSSETTQDLEPPLRTMLSSIQALILSMDKAEGEYSKESAVPEVRQAVSKLLMAARSSDASGLLQSSQEVEKGGNRAIELAKARLLAAVNTELVQNFIRDLAVLVPLHANVSRKASADLKNRDLWRRAAETGRDVLSVVTELDVASSPPALEDEFASLQSMLVGPIGDLDAFEVVNDSRDVAQAARQAVAEDPHAGDATDILSTIAELEMVLPDILEQPSEQQASKVVTVLPSLKKAVKKRDKKRAEERLEAPEDDLVRLSRYARAGADEEHLKRAQEGVSAKAGKWAQKQKKKAKGMADPIRQQRIMEAVSELEAMAPLQMEAFSGFVEEPELLVARDELEELSAGLANMTGEVSSLFPDLLLVTPIDLDSAIGALLNSEAHDANAPALVLRNIDLETLVPRTPSLASAPEMLQLDMLDTPLSGRKKSSHGLLFEAEPLAQSVVQSLSSDGNDDEQILEGEELGQSLDQLIESVSGASKLVLSLPGMEPRLLAAQTILFVDRICNIVRSGKNVAASVAASDQANEDTPILYSGLEDLANRVAELVFGVDEYLDVVQDGGGSDEAENLRASCGAVSKQLLQLEQLGTSQALLLSVQKLEIPSAESALAGANAKLEAARSGGSSSSLEKPSPALLEELKRLAKAADTEWQWDAFLECATDVLKRTFQLVPMVHDSGKRVLLRQAADALEGRAKQLMWASVHKPDELSAFKALLIEACDGLLAAIIMLDTKAFRAIRTIENTSGAASIHNALIEGVARSPKAGEIFRCIKSLQDKISPLTQELRAFKQAPVTFVPGTFVNLVVELLCESGLILRGLEEANTKMLLQGLREQLSETSIMFLFTALDMVELKTPECHDDSLVALKRLSLALLQLGKWANKAVTALLPTRSVAADADAARISRQLKALKGFIPSSNTTDLATVRGLVVGMSDALSSTDVTLTTSPIDPADVADAIVHVLLVASSLLKHMTHNDTHVQQLCGMSELLAHSSYDVIFRVRDLELPIGNPSLVEEAVQSALQLSSKMRSIASVLSGKLVKLGELRQVVLALQHCEELLGDAVPSPSVSSIAEFERAVKRETSAVMSFCGTQQRFDTLDFGRFGSALILCASVVRNNVSIVADGSTAASIVRITGTMISAGQNVVKVLETTATSDPTSDMYHMAQVSMTEELRTVNLLAGKLEEIVGEVSLHQPAAAGNRGNGSVASSPPASSTQQHGRASSGSPPSGNSSGSSSPGGSPVQKHQARQTLMIGKALSVAVSELSKKQTAVFAHADEMPSGLSHSLELLAPTEKKICSLLVSSKPGSELQKTLLYYLNLLKHLVSGYLKSDKGEKLGELVKRTKDWASKVILAMQSMEQQDSCDEEPQRKALEDLHSYLVTSVVLCCSVCKKAISGGFTTADGLPFHNSCFTCSVCHRPISGSYFREGSQIFCQDDIPMTNNLCCHRCSEPIELGTNYVECKAQTYHRECFCCVTCGRPLYGTYYTSDTGDVSCADCA